MYHPLPITDNNPPGTGDIDYLQFHLTRITTDLLSDQETETVQAFFSLRQALSQLLVTDLRYIDPQVARHAGMEYSQRAFLRSPNNLNDYASLIYHHPQSGQKNDIIPGVYLYSDLLSPRQIYASIGLPMPPDIMADFPFNMPLAFLDSSQRDIVALAHYEQLRSHAQDYLDLLQAVTQDMGHQLVIKGQYRDPKYQPGKFYQRAHYVEHHYFDHPQKPVQALLDTNLLCLDRYVADNQQQKHHQHVYTLGVNQQLTSLAKVVRIGEEKDPFPTAGIYLQAFPNLWSLEQSTGIPFSQIPHCNTGRPHLLLASYHYNFGFSLEPGDGLLQLMQHQQAMRKEDTVPLTPTYTAISTYEFMDGPDNLQPFKQATALFHYDRPSRALLQLLSLDFGLFNTPDGAHPSKMALKGGGLRDATGTVLAYLQKAPVTQQGPGQVQLVFEGLLAAAIATAMHVQGYKAIPYSGNTISLRMGQFNTEGHFEPAQDNLDFLRALVSQPISMLDYNLQVQEAPSMALPTSPYIALLWSHGNQPPAGAVTQIVRHTLEDAHQFLLAMDPRWFHPDHPEAPKLVAAHLYDSHDPQIIASRYYLPLAIGAIPEGFYVQYNATSAAALALAAGQPGLERVTTATSDHFHTFRHQTQLTPPIEGHHLRVFARQDPASGQGL